MEPDCRRLAWLPRVSGSWSPAWLKQTKIAAGFGLFSDPMNLELLTRQQDQVSVSTFYSTGGAVTLGPVTTGFAVNNSRSRPPSKNYSLSLERMLPRGFYGKVSYLGAPAGTASCLPGPPEVCFSPRFLTSWGISAPTGTTPWS